MPGIRTLLKPHVRDLGAFQVKRVLPALGQQMVGPFIFFDHVGPASLPAGRGVDVRPHPHIGLATVTYLFEGEMLHRDSLGTVQLVRPGEVNWMTAGRGIVHSERSAPERIMQPQMMHGIQTWVALPRSHETVAPSFEHHAADALPVFGGPGLAMRLIVGDYDGLRAPTAHYSPIFYVAVEAEAGARFAVANDHEERAVYLVEGAAAIDGMRLPAAHMAVLERHAPAVVTVEARTRLMLLGGAKLEGDRLIWWNFVASSRELLEAGKAGWRDYVRNDIAAGNAQFGLIAGDPEWIPLPDR